MIEEMPPFAQPVIPDDAVVAWSGRLIVNQQGYVDLPHDRQGTSAPGTELSQRFLLVLAEKIGPMVLFPLISDLLKAGWMDTRRGEDFIVYMDDDLTMHANTNGSGGYCYVTAWWTPH